MSIPKNAIKITFQENEHMPLEDFALGSVGITRDVAGGVEEILMRIKIKWDDGTFALDLRTGIIGEFPPDMPLEPMEAEVMLRGA